MWQLREIEMSGKHETTKKCMNTIVPLTQLTTELFFFMISKSVFAHRKPWKSLQLHIKLLPKLP
jgi:hypothetical protein